jgi:ankyrin repeat protein
MDVSPPPPQDDDPIITEFTPRDGQWELTDENIKRMDPKTAQTILHNYCQHINTTPVEVYRLLIEVKGCDINAQDKYNDTPLYDAIYHFNLNKGGDISVLMYLLTQTNIDVNTKGQYGFTLFHAACYHTNNLPLEIFKLLIETLGCDVNAQDNHKNTPLHHAFRSFDPNEGCNIAVLMYLLNQKGVNVNIKGYIGETLLHLACGNISHLPLDVFKLLIETMGCDVNTQDEDNDTALHYALRHLDPNGDITVLTYLLNQKGANGNIKGKDGYTLLHIACQCINNLPLDIYKVLIETYGLDVNAQDDYNNTPLHHAFREFKPRNGDITALAYLINQNNVNLNIKNKGGCNLLHSACINYLPSYRRSVELDAEYDTVFCQIVEIIAERCVQEVFEGKLSLEATTTM